MSHARVEEISDSDSDPDIMDLSTIIAPSSSSQNQSNPSLMRPQAIPTTSSMGQRYAAPPEESKRWHLLYPLYFDARATRVQGRRVSKELAVKNPLAQSIAEVVHSFGLNSVFEPMKTHPKDWANPGRVRNENGKWLGGKIKNKHHLYLIVADYLRDHPTKPEDPLRLPMRGLPVPEGVPPAPAVPRGWRINEIIPLHSSAMTGGGVSENMLKDLQAAMQGQEPGSAPPAIESAKKAKKKDKGKKK